MKRKNIAEFDGAAPSAEGTPDRPDPVPASPGDARRIDAIYVRADPASTVGRNSIARQLRSCRQFARRRGSRLFVEHAAGGPVDRPALRMLMSAARAGEIGAVVVESIDRVSRDPSTLRAIWTELRDLGVSVSAPAHGRIDEDDFAIRGFQAREQQRRHRAIRRR